MTTYQHLTPEEERVIVDKGTESPFSGEYNTHKERGTYLCKRCLSPLYHSSDKFESGCGWPSFDDAIPGKVQKVTDRDGRRTEIICSNCNAHLGHVFWGEHFTEKNTRHCVNSISMTFIPEIIKEQHLEKVTLGGGCFWCIDTAFRQLQGVVEVQSGYSGGETLFPTYEKVSRGNTGHIEVVEITFDKTVISLSQILYVFFSLHNPTTPDRQGNDIGPQYASVIFYRTEEQQKTALDIIQGLEHQQIFSDPIVTKVEAFKQFWIAEEYHQDYAAKSPQNPYCTLVVHPKLSKLRKEWSHLLKEE